VCVCVESDGVRGKKRDSVKERGEDIETWFVVKDCAYVVIGGWHSAIFANLFHSRIINDCPCKSDYTQWTH